jgi:hypothetical protein
MDVALASASMMEYGGDVGQVEFFIIALLKLFVLTSNFSATSPQSLSISAHSITVSSR